MNKEQMLELLNKADKARNMAYAPYSNFFVGSCILLKDGSIINGANVENASYSLTICAERVALSQIVINNKASDIVAMAISADTQKPCAPCGACRQVMNEFLPKDTPIIFGKPNGEYYLTKMELLLPAAFDKSFL